MRNGFRKPAVASKGDAIQDLQTRLANVEMALRVSQMLNKNLLEQLQRLDKDVHNSSTVTNELEYRTRALIALGNVEAEKIDAAADNLKLADYNTASDKEDQEKGYTVGNIVDENSVVIISSETEDGEGGIFRSKFQVKETGVAALVEALSGKKQGDKVEVPLNGKKHTITIEAVRIAPVPVEVVETEAQEQQLQ